MCRIEFDGLQSGRQRVIAIWVLKELQTMVSFNRIPMVHEVGHDLSGDAVRER